MAATSCFATSILVNLYLQIRSPQLALVNLRIKVIFDGKSLEMLDLIVVLFLAKQWGGKTNDKNRI